jgi:hypothetical protein
VLDTVEKIFLRATSYFTCIFKKKFDLKKIWASIKRPNFGSPGEKWHLDVVLAERHKIYYREGSGASSQRL